MAAVTGKAVVKIGMQSRMLVRNLCSVVSGLLQLTALCFVSIACQCTLANCGADGYTRSTIPLYCQHQCLSNFSLACVQCRNKIAVSRFCHSKFVDKTGSVYFTEAFMLYHNLLRIKLFSFFSLMVVFSSCYHLQFRKWPFSTAVGHHESYMNAQTIFQVCKRRRKEHYHPMTTE